MRRAAAKGAGAAGGPAGPDCGRLTAARAGGVCVCVCPRGREGRWRRRPRPRSGRGWRGGRLLIVPASSRVLARVGRRAREGPRGRGSGIPSLAANLSRRPLPPRGAPASRRPLSGGERRGARGIPPGLAPGSREGASQPWGRGGGALCRQPRPPRRAGVGVPRGCGESPLGGNAPGVGEEGPLSESPGGPRRAAGGGGVSCASAGSFGVRVLSSPPRPRGPRVVGEPSTRLSE